MGESVAGRRPPGGDILLLGLVDSIGRGTGGANVGRADAPIGTARLVESDALASSVRARTRPEM